MSAAELHPSGPVSPPAGRLRRWAMSAIVWYQRATEGRPSPCRFTPSCSAYALESYQTFSTGRATWLAARRLVRCRPFGPSGYDPVPSPAGSDHPLQRDASDPVAATSVKDC